MPASGSEGGGEGGMRIAINTNDHKEGGMRIASNTNGHNKYDLIMLNKILIFVIIGIFAIFSVFVRCSRNEILYYESTEESTEGDSRILDSWINDEVNEPKIIAATSNSLTVKWPAIQNAIRYDVYQVTSADPSIVETKFTYTDKTEITLTSNYSQNLRIKAVDSSSQVLDQWLIFGYYNTQVPSYIKGSFYDNFEDGIFNPAYGIKNPSQVTESGGYMQLSQNETNNGPRLYIGYDPEGKRYVRFSIKRFQHRSSEYFDGEICFVSFSHNNDIATLYNAHNAGSDPVRFGTLMVYNNYDCREYNPFSRPRSDLDSTEYFDVWFTLNVIIDLYEGSFRVGINGSYFTTFDTPYIFKDKIIFLLSSYGWGTGHYVRLDDLSIESSDTPFL